MNRGVAGCVTDRVVEFTAWRRSVCPIADTRLRPKDVFQRPLDPVDNLI